MRPYKVQISSSKDSFEKTCTFNVARVQIRYRSPQVRTFSKKKVYLQRGMRPDPGCQIRFCDHDFSA